MLLHVYMQSDWFQDMSELSMRNRAYLPHINTESHPQLTSELCWWRRIDPEMIAFHTILRWISRHGRILTWKFTRNRIHQPVINTVSRPTGTSTSCWQRRLDQEVKPLSLNQLLVELRHASLFSTGDKRLSIVEQSVSNDITIWFSLIKGIMTQASHTLSQLHIPCVCTPCCNAAWTAFALKSSECE